MGPQMHELERTSLRIVEWTCEELLMKGVRRQRYTGSMETSCDDDDEAYRVHDDDDDDEQIYAV